MPLLLLIPCLVFQPLANESADPKYSIVDDSDYEACGVNCVYLVASMKGIDTDLEAVRKLVEPDENGSSSLADLERAASQLGFVTVPIRVDSLIDVPPLSILHVRKFKGQPTGNHFCVFLGHTEQGDPVILDAPSVPEAIPAERFDDYWTGVALVPCDSEEDAEEVRGAVLDSQPLFYRLPRMASFWLTILLTAVIAFTMSRVLR